MGTGLLAGKHGVIFGALNEQSIAWQVALACRAQGARLTLTNAPVALRLGSVQALAEQCEAPLIAADATSLSDLQGLAEQAGKVDFILHSIGMSPNVRKRRSYGALNYDHFKQTLDISALSFHRILQVFEQQGGLNPWASVVGLSYIAAQRAFSGYGDMAEAKAVLESIARSYGYRLGKSDNIRVNTISQSPTRTSAGEGISSFEGFFNYAARFAPLGNATAEDCANYCVFLFSDLSRRITMQNLYCDGGFSSVGVSEDVIALLQDNPEAGAGN